MQGLDPRDQLIAELRAELAEMRARVVELERQLKQSSQNSSRPPSTDAPHIKRPPKQGPTGRKPGGQPGHKRNQRSLLPADQVDEFVDHWPPWCEDCNSELSSVGRIEVGEAERHQVTELPVAKAHVTEHRMHTQHCEGCGWATPAMLPEDVPRGAFGTRLQVVTSLLTGVYRMSKRTTQEILNDLFGVSMALGSVSACEQVVSQALEEPVREARAYAQQQSVGHADETGWREGRSRAWLWVLATALVTVFQIHRRRNTEAAQALLGTFAGTLVSDRWGRPITSTIQRDASCAGHTLHATSLPSVNMRARWARSAKSLSRRPWTCSAYGIACVDDTLSRRGFERKMKPVRQRIEGLLDHGARIGVPKASGMCEKIAKHGDALWTFVRVEGVPPTNNDAERALRFAVLWRKGSFGTHSEAGSRFVERILTARTSLRQQGRNVADYITRATEAQVLGLPPPSLLPQT
jgi:transposase